MSAVQSVCVFTGSNPGRTAIYADFANRLGVLLAERGIRLVYGGGHVGLMGRVADACLNAGGEVTGVIPHALAEKELAHEYLTELHTVGSMHERKALMADLSDAFIAMPGGIGTMEELFEVWTWAQLGYHDKPVGLLNVQGFFDPLIEFLEHVVAEEFLKPGHKRMLHISDDPVTLLAAFAAYEPPEIHKWVEKAET